MSTSIKEVNRAFKSSLSWKPIEQGNKKMQEGMTKQMEKMDEPVDNLLESGKRLPLDTNQHINRLDYLVSTARKAMEETAEKASEKSSDALREESSSGASASPSLKMSPPRRS